MSFYLLAPPRRLPHLLFLVIFSRFNLKLKITKVTGIYFYLILIYYTYIISSLKIFIHFFQIFYILFIFIYYIFRILGIAFFYILIFHLSSLILISYKFKNIRGQAFYHFFIKRLTINTKLVNYNRLRDNPLAYHYIIINIALATPIPRYAMRPATSNASFFMPTPPLLEYQLYLEYLYKFQKKTFQIYLTIGNQQYII